MQRSIGLKDFSGVALAEGARRARPRRLFAHIVVATALILGILALAKLATNDVKGGPVGSGTPWAAHIQKMDEALARKDIGGAERAWHAAYVTALASRRWDGRLAVGDAYLRIGEAAWAPGAAQARARTNYMAALFHARQQGSLDGVLRVAEAFAALGDREVMDGCLRIAEVMAGDSRDPQARERVRAFRERLATPFVEAEARP